MGLVSASAPLFEFQRSSGRCPVETSRLPLGIRLLPWALPPYGTCGTRDPVHTGLPARHLPPTGFGYPLDGLRPRIPCRPCFRPAAPTGFPLRSFLLPGSRSGAYRRSMPRLPLLRTDDYGITEVCQIEPPVRLPGSSSRESLACDGCLAHRDAGCSLGLFPFQGFYSPVLAGTSARLLPRASARRRVTPSPRHMRLGVSIDRWPVRPGGPDTPLRVSAPQHPWHWASTPTRAMVSPRKAPAVTVRCVSLLGPTRAYLSCQGC